MRTPLVRHPWRVVVVVVALQLVVILAVWMHHLTDTSEPGTESLPSDIEHVVPAPGTTTGLQNVDVAADLRRGFVGALSIDGTCVPKDQVSSDPSTGSVSLLPDADDQFRDFEPGVHEVVVFYRDSREPAPENDCDASGRSVSAYRWSFRATS